MTTYAGCALPYVRHQCYSEQSWIPLTRKKGWRVNNRKALANGMNSFLLVPYYYEFRKKKFDFVFFLNL